MRKKLSLWSFARRHKVYYNLDRRYLLQVWLLEGIEREEGSLPGSGARVLKRMIREAHQKKKSLLLYPVNRRLRKYYASLGFIPCRPLKEWMLSGGMINQFSSRQK